MTHSYTIVLTDFGGVPFGIIRESDLEPAQFAKAFMSDPKGGFTDGCPEYLEENGEVVYDFYELTQPYTRY